MGKAAQRKKEAQAAAAGDVHARIADEARAARAAKVPGGRAADETPALKALFASANAALESSVPATFEHEGRTYYLRVCIGMARLMVFDAPATTERMAEAVQFSFEEFGHQPSH